MRRRPRLPRSPTLQEGAGGGALDGGTVVGDEGGDVPGGTVEVEVGDVEGAEVEVGDVEVVETEVVEGIVVAVGSPVVVVDETGCRLLEGASTVTEGA